MVAITYCEGWFRARKTISRPLTVEQARERHSAGKLYTVLVGDPERPTCFLEVVGENRYLGVEFLDDQLREHLVYSFQRTDDGRLFLSVATWRTYRGDSDEVATAELYYFNQTGSVEVHNVDVQSNSERIGSKTIDISANYEPWPEFGRYEHLLSQERRLIQ
jgi:hypothetical protein